MKSTHPAFERCNETRNLIRRNLAVCNALTTNCEIDLAFLNSCFFFSFVNQGWGKFGPTTSPSPPSQKDGEQNFDYQDAFKDAENENQRGGKKIKILSTTDLNRLSEVRIPSLHFREMSVVDLDSQFVILTNRCPQLVCTWGEHIAGNESKSCAFEIEFMSQIWIYWWNLQFDRCNWDRKWFKKTKVKKYCLFVLFGVNTHSPPGPEKMFVM